VANNFDVTWVMAQVGHAARAGVAVYTIFAHRSIKPQSLAQMS
jgi:hypothetical protein